jgi:hypothetical protein
MQKQVTFWTLSFLLDTGAEWLSEYRPTELGNNYTQICIKGAIGTD